MMEMDEDFIDSLTSLGLSRKEALVLGYLMMRGSATAKDIITDLSIHQPQLYNIMSSLIRKGFIFVQESKPKVYVAERPSIVLEKLEREFSRKKASILNAITKGYVSENLRRNVMWVTRGIDNVLNNSISLIQEASSELYIEAHVSMIQRLLKHIASSTSRGVKAYVLVYPSIDEVTSTQLREAGALEVKVHPLGQFYLIVPDAQHSVFMPRMMSLEQGSNAYGYVFRDEFMSLFFLHYYFEGWRRSETKFRRELRVNDFPLIFRSHRFAVWEIMRAKENGLKIKVTVQGRLVKGGDRLTISGRPGKVRAEGDVVNFELDSNGNTFLVGGENSVLEDVEAERVIIELSGDS